MPITQRNRRSRSLQIRWWCMGCLLIVLTGCPRTSPPMPPTPVPKNAESAAPALSAAAVLELRNHALGQLENLQYVEADATLTKLGSEWQSDLFVVQNRAIAWQLALDGIDPVRETQRFEAAKQSAQAALDAFAKVAPQSAIPEILRARVALRLGEKDAARTALRAATQRDPENVAAWYDLYLALREANNPQTNDLQAELLAAGKRVAALQPDNWYFWKDWVVDLARANDPALKPLLERMRTELAPFAAVFERDVRVNPVKLIDTALGLIETGPAARVATSVLPLRNILLLEARSDESGVLKHSLDFVIADLQNPPASPPVNDIETIISGQPVRFNQTLTTVAAIDGPAVRGLQSIDIDVDGRNELLVLERGRLVVLGQDESKAWTPRFETPLTAEYDRLWAGDLDDDGDVKDPPPENTVSHRADPDLVLSGPGGLLVMENRLAADGSRSFVPQTENVPWAELSNATGATLLDLDGDGDLDLFIAGPQPRCFLFRGNWQYAEITERSLFKLEGAPTAAVAVDWDRDVDLDLIVTTAAGVYWLENLRHGRFRTRKLEDGFAPLIGSVRLAVAELDGNGAWDLVGTGPRGTTAVLTQRSRTGAGPCLFLKTQVVDKQPGRWLQVADLDHNGFADVFVGGELTQLFWQTGPGSFSTNPISTLETISTAVPADVDGDGDLDLWLAGTTLSAVKNDGGIDRDWIEIRLRGLQEKGSGLSNSKRVNHQGLGSLVELRSGNRYQAAIVEGQSVRFGLGTRRTPGIRQPPTPELIRILWTNGVPKAVLDPPINGVITEEQLPIGSCPYLYAWDGERFRFVTDLLWNAPLGLKFAEDVVAGWREWEHLKIDGKFLQPRNGEYVLQITEELWEIGYFDQVRLTAIDHPADVQVFTNEKVGPATIAEPKLHTVTKPLAPRAARRGDGMSVLDEVQASDGRYAVTAQDKLASGLFRENVLELDFGDLGDAKQLTLFLTGWLYPTDTSLNVQLSQHPSLPGPQPPSLWVPDEAGTWKNVRPFLGFPGGKPKTIALDVTDAVNPRDARLRIVTNMDFNWDAAWVTVDEPPVSVREVPLKLVRADLHHRGISQAVHRPGNAPEDYDYDTVVPGPSWPPLTGRLTRYGDVTPLLTDRDDHLAVFGAGDEMTVVFAVPDEPLPAGWVRDFVMHNIGWDKDAVLNTVYGSSVEPLPFEGMSVYGEARPLDERYATYLRTYQTREQSPRDFWNRVRTDRGPVIPRVRP